MAPKGRKIAIVGCGPRGLGALEALARHMDGADVAVDVTVFDPWAWPAAGPNFSPDEPPECLLNLPLRSIDLPASPVPGFVDFGAWAQADYPDAEAFPPRARLGAYLHARLEALLDNLPQGLSVTLHPLRITQAQQVDGAWRLRADQAAFGPFDDVLLSLGQPQTENDPQMQKWQAHANAQGLDLMPAYPGKALVDRAGRWAGQVVAVRGLGLSTLDVVRMLTIGLGGRFDGTSYVPSGREPGLIAPFSLDGHAPAPKPANARIDALFDPTEAETAAFRAALQDALSADAETALRIVADALVAPTLRVLGATGGTADQAVVAGWLATERSDHGSQETRETVDAIKGNLAEAEGQTPPSAGYVIGQLWRKWQPTLRAVFDSHAPGAETAGALATFDEGLKRYSYGAPVGSLRHLLAVIDAGLVYPCATDDPDITLSDSGWHLQSGARGIEASVMVDSVLPPPVLDVIEEPLVAKLVEEGLLTMMGDGLGARCAPDGAAIDRAGGRVDGLWIAGRLTSGSAISSDSIHDCFGIPTRHWARAVLRRG
ncbi:FAD/NAD(P)-binding protein [Actibacterium ureilyticum]|uniref:FAD/NAD(P)-binding protein n=1 Tax=Actibacterium ureilyticum TaxID=1590614 RepID=UPI000BAA9A12|nr:FAD/NAD(P)-binding domain-containing protein [Actibacterium ureilyticum]